MSTNLPSRPGKFTPMGSTDVRPDDPRFADTLLRIFPEGFVAEEDPEATAAACSIVVNTLNTYRPHDLVATDRTTAILRVLYPLHRTASGTTTGSFDGFYVSEEHNGTTSVTEMILFHDNLCLRLDEASECDGLPDHLIRFFAALKARVEDIFRPQKTMHDLTLALGRTALRPQRIVEVVVDEPGPSNYYDFPLGLKLDTAYLLSRKRQIGEVEFIMEKDPAIEINATDDESRTD